MASEDPCVCVCVIPLTVPLGRSCTSVKPNEREGAVSALFPAPLHFFRTYSYMGFPAVMSATFGSLFLGKSLPFFITE